MPLKILALIWPRFGSGFPFLLFGGLMGFFGRGRSVGWNFVICTSFRRAAPPPPAAPILGFERGKEVQEECELVWS